MSEKYLKFGTGGLRGIMGPATNQMNMNTIRRATKGLANYIVSLGRQADGVVIGHDTRMNSREFALEAAGVLLADGIKVYLFDRCTPTPEISFAIRQKKAVAGIVITASHNAKEYNGYKVYWEDGGQITSPHDKNIMAEVEKVEHVENVQVIDVSACAQILVSGKASEELKSTMALFEKLGEDIEETYVSTIQKTVESLINVKSGEKDLKIAYTPLHGTGLYPVSKVLKNNGFTNVYFEPAQSVQDGTFPTVGYPNPESAKAWDLGLKFAKEVDADVVFATDPDADRVGMYVKDTASGKYIWFTGNMAGVLVGEYILREGKYLQKFQTNLSNQEKGSLDLSLACLCNENDTCDKKNTIVRTIVTSKMLDVIAKRYDVDVLETLTGFKYIGEQIRWFEENCDRNFVYGFEESCGCLLGDYVRDKDGVAAVLMLCEMAQNLKHEGRTLWDYMQEIYAEYGYYLEQQKTIAFEGEDGAEKMSQIMDQIRVNTPKAIGEFQVNAFRDYKSGTRMLLDTGKEEILTLPKSNVMYFELNDEAWCCIRPSGTEPKLKMYFGVVGDSQSNAIDKAKAMEDAFVDLFFS